MLRWISNFGGLLIMMGQHHRSEALFYYFRLEDHIPENHLLRLIDKHVSLEFVRAQLKDSYSETGRPSVDPELLLRILLIGISPNTIAISVPRARCSIMGGAFIGIMPSTTSGAAKSVARACFGHNAPVLPSGA